MADLSPLQTRRLAQNAHRWLQTVERVNSAWSAWEHDLRSTGAEDELHLLVLALKHITRCVELLEASGTQLEGSNALHESWAAIKDLRDALEHEEEYIAGMGRREHLRRQVALWSERGFLSGVIGGSDGIDHFVFMGGQYSLTKVIHAAKGLKGPITEVATRRII